MARSGSLYALGKAELRIMLALILRGQQSTGDLCERIGTSRNGLKSALAKLHREGWITRGGRKWAPASALLERVSHAPSGPATHPQPERVRHTPSRVRHTPSTPAVTAADILGEGAPHALDGGTIGGSSSSLSSKNRRNTLDSGSKATGEPVPPEVRGAFEQFWAIDRAFRREPHRTQCLELFWRICRGLEDQSSAAVEELGLGPAGVALVIVKGTRDAQPDLAGREEQYRPTAANWLRSAVWAQDKPLEPPLGSDWDLCRRIVRQRETEPKNNWLLGSMWGDLSASEVEDRKFQARVIERMIPRWNEWVAWWRGED